MNLKAQSGLSMLGAFIVFGIVYFGYFAKVVQDHVTALATNGSTTGLWNFIIANTNLWVTVVYIIALLALLRYSY